jgi:hypothetical protein
MNKRNYICCLQTQTMLYAALPCQAVLSELSALQSPAGLSRLAAAAAELQAQMRDVSQQLEELAAQEAAGVGGGDSSLQKCRPRWHCWVVSLIMYSIKGVGAGQQFG